MARQAALKLPWEKLESPSFRFDDRVKLPEIWFVRTDDRAKRPEVLKTLDAVGLRLPKEQDIFARRPVRQMLRGGFEGACFCLDGAAPEDHQFYTFGEGGKRINITTEEILSRNIPQADLVCTFEGRGGAMLFVVSGMVFDFRGFSLSGDVSESNLSEGANLIVGIKDN